jgi:hypothetical protein
MVFIKDREKCTFGPLQLLVVAVYVTRLNRKIKIKFQFTTKDDLLVESFKPILELTHLPTRWIPSNIFGVRRPELESH